MVRKRKRSSEVKAYHFPHYLRTPQAERQTTGHPNPTPAWKTLQRTKTSLRRTCPCFLHALPPPPPLCPRWNQKAQEMPTQLPHPLLSFTLNLVHRASLLRLVLAYPFLLTMESRAQAPGSLCLTPWVPHSRTARDRPWPWHRDGPCQARLLTSSPGEGRAFWKASSVYLVGSGGQDVNTLTLDL